MVHEQSKKKTYKTTKFFDFAVSNTTIRTRKNVDILRSSASIIQRRYRVSQVTTWRSNTWVDDLLLSARAKPKLDW